MQGQRNIKVSVDMLIGFAQLNWFMHSELSGLHFNTLDCLRDYSKSSDFYEQELAKLCQEALDQNISVIVISAD